MQYNHWLVASCLIIWMIVFAFTAQAQSVDLHLSPYNHRFIIHSKTTTLNLDSNHSYFRFIFCISNQRKSSQDDQICQYKQARGNTAHLVQHCFIYDKHISRIPHFLWEVFVWKINFSNQNIQARFLSLPSQ